MTTTADREDKKLMGVRVEWTMTVYEPAKPVQGLPPNMHPETMATLFVNATGWQWEDYATGTVAIREAAPTATDPLAGKTVAHLTNVTYVGMDNVVTQRPPEATPAK